MNTPRGPVLSVDCGLTRGARAGVVAGTAAAVVAVLAAGLAWPLALALISLCVAAAFGAAGRVQGTLHWFDGGWWWQRPGLHGAVLGPWPVAGRCALGTRLAVVTLRTGRLRKRHFVVHRDRVGERRWRLVRTLLRHPPAPASQPASWAVP